MITWTLFLQSMIIFIILYLLLSGDGRQLLKKSIAKVLTFSTSKRFIVLMIATWFVYKKVTIDPYWILLAGFFIGIDTLQNHGFFMALSEYIKNVKPKKQ